MRIMPLPYFDVVPDIENSDMKKLWDSEKGELTFKEFPNVAYDKVCLFYKQIELIEQNNLFVSTVYNRGNWGYHIYKLPSEDDIKFASSG